MPKISVIIPVHNRAYELKRAIKSVLKQTIQDFEILVVDDFSDINIEQVISEFNDNRIRYFRLKQKGNANVCRNLGIQSSSGDYIAMLDSDDEWFCDHLQLKLAYLISQNADGVFGSYMIYNGEEVKNIISKPVPQNQSMINYILSDGSVATPTHFYKSDTVKNILWDESLERHQDYDFSVRYSKKYRFVASQEVTCTVHWSKNEKRLEHFPSMMKFINKYTTEIDPGLYCQYHRRVYTTIINREDIDKNIKSHYKTNSIKYIEVLSLTDYISTFGIDKPLAYRIFLRLQYNFKRFFKTKKNA